MSALFQSTPHGDKMLSQLVDVMVRYTRYCIIDQMAQSTGWRSGELCDRRSGAMKSGVLRGSSSIVSHDNALGRCLVGK